MALASDDPACLLAFKPPDGAQAVRAELAEHGALSPFRSVALRLGPTDEAAVAPALEALRSEFDSGVSVGSYPARPAAPGPAQSPLPCTHRECWCSAAHRQRHV